MNINKDQIKLIHIAKNKLGLAEEEYRQMLKGFGVNSSKNLTYKDADFLIRQFEKMGFRHSAAESTIKTANKTKYNNLNNRPEKYATPKQLRLIEGLWMKISDTKRLDALEKFIKRLTGREKMQWLLKSDITKIKKALEEIEKRNLSNNLDN